MEVFAAKNATGDVIGVLIAVPQRCGLKQADTLQIDKDMVFALSKRSVLPIDLPRLSTESRNSLIAHSTTGKKLPVAEFTPLGVLDSYLLNLVVIS